MINIFRGSSLDRMGLGKRGGGGCAKILKNKFLILKSFKLDTQVNYMLLILFCIIQKGFFRVGA